MAPKIGNMSSLDQAESRSSRMYAEGNFDGAQKVYEAWIRDNEKDCAAIDLAKALNNLGHAKYMQVSFEKKNISKSTS